MANLMDLVKARNQLQASSIDLKRILIYGQPKSGKTFLAASIAKVPSIKRIYWFDLENGSCTLVNPEIGLTPEHMKKIEVVQLPDTSETPIAIETMLKVISTNKEITICESHGKVNCTACKPRVQVGTAKTLAVGSKVAKINIEPRVTSAASAPSVSIFPAIKDLGAEDCIVIDSLSQLGDSAFEVALRTTAGDKSAYAKYGEQGRLLSDFLGMLQQTKTNLVCITHVTVNEAEDTKKDTVIPLCGTRNFSLKLSKYFSTVIYLNLELKKFKAGSSPDYKLNIVAGDRLGVRLQDTKSATTSLEDLFT